MWQAWKQTSIASPTGPVPVAEGDIVAVIVVPKWSDAFEAASQIVKSETSEEKRGG